MKTKMIYFFDYLFVCVCVRERVCACKIEKETMIKGERKIR